jgi:hypothetical protein
MAKMSGVAAQNGSAGGELKRVIWVLWLQGFEAAPQVVRHCLLSWKLRNPGWEVVNLDEDTLVEYVDPDSLAALRSLKLTPQKFADLIRLYLLSGRRRLGGRKMLLLAPSRRMAARSPGFGFLRVPAARHGWLRAHGRLSAFGNAGPSGDRILANWFLAAKPGNWLISRFYEEHRDCLSR